MYTQTMKIATFPVRPKMPTPTTGRGRALYTTAWFLTGIQPIETYDDPSFHIRGAIHEHA